MIRKSLIILLAVSIVSLTGCQHPGTPTQTQGFIANIQNIIDSSSTRLVKLESFKKLYEIAKTDEEKIAALPSLSSLKPIEYADFIISVANNTQESEPVRSEAIRTLNNAYLLDDALVKEIGGANAYNGMNKIAKFMDNIVHDSKDSPQLYQAALSGYAYTNHDKAAVLARSLLNKKQRLSNVESDLVINVMFSDKSSMNEFIPLLINSPESVSDAMVVKLSTVAADPLILKALTRQQKTQIMSLLQTHSFAKEDPNYQVNKDTIEFNLQSLK